MGTSAKVVCDSISEHGVRLTTMVLEYPRIIHSEVMTHRMFSRNASSSRAIPVEKQIERIQEHPFIPDYWGKNQKGMQAYEEVNEIEAMVDMREFLDLGEDHEFKLIPRAAWIYGFSKAIALAKGFAKAGLHKQLVNRLLEPFSYIQVIVTATEWEGFFAQRLHPAAQPEIQELAKVMKEAMDASIPKVLENDEWHLPFINQDDWNSIVGDNLNSNDDEADIKIAKKVSVARCARVSYGLNERGWGDIEKDLALYEMLITQGHWSPTEHQATPMKYSGFVDAYNDQEEKDWEEGITHCDRNHKYWSSNFRGWIQNRKLIEN